MRKMLLVICFFILNGCTNITRLQYVDVPDSSSPVDSARIVFNRRFSVLGWAAPSFVIDRGKPNIDMFGVAVLNEEHILKYQTSFDTGNGVIFLAEKPRPFGESLYFTTIVGRCIFTSTDPNENRAKLIVPGKSHRAFYNKEMARQPIYVKTDDGWRKTDLPILDEVNCGGIYHGARTRLLFSHKDFKIPYGYKIYDVALIGILENGKTLEWDRPAGLMKLELLTLSGLRVVAKDFVVQAGKTYYIDYKIFDKQLNIKEEKTGVRPVSQ